MDKTSFGQQDPTETSNSNIPSAKKPHTRRILFYSTLIIFGIGAAYSIISSPTTGWIPAMAYIIFGSILFAYRKSLLEGKKKQDSSVVASANSQATQPVHIGVSSTEPQSAQPIPTKTKPTTKHLFGVIGMSLGALIILFIAVSVFQPQAYLLMVRSQGQADHEVTTTNVDVLQTLTLKQDSDAGAAGGSATQTITLLTDTQFVAPSSWSFITRAHNEAQQLDDGVEAIVVDGTAYQRQAGSTDSYSTYTFAEGEYDQTKHAIESSSFFQPKLLEYAGTPRFVFNTDGQPWWMLHFRIPIDVDAIDQAQPDWYSPELYAFGKDATLPNQQIEFTLDIWVNPFTRKVAHEQWVVSKVSDDDPQYHVQLDIQLDRSLRYPNDLSIVAPAVENNTTAPTDGSETPTNQ